MQRRRFDPDLCLKCGTVDCIMRCQYIHLELDRAKEEHDRLVRGRMSSILHECVTCGNCVEACAMDKIKDKLVDVFIAARRDLVEEGRIPPGVRDLAEVVSASAGDA